MESKEDYIEVEQSMGNHVEDGCFRALLLPPNTLRGLELLVMLPLKSIWRTRTHQKILCDNRVWCGLEQCWAVLWIFERTVGSGSLNISEPKNRLLQFFEKQFKIEESSVLVFSKKPSELMVFMKESTKNRWYFGRFFNFLKKFENCSYTYAKINYLEIFRTGR